MRNVADDALVKSLVNDFRHGIASSGGSMIPGQRPASTVSVVGSGRVQDPVLGPKYRPIDPNTTTDQPGSGWKEPAPLRPPEGLQHIDRMLDEEDRIWRAQRIREVAEAAPVQRALAEAQGKAQNEDNKPKGKGPKP
jgi:hypothetical protein